MLRPTIKIAGLRDLPAVTKLLREYFSHDRLPWNRHIKPALKLLLKGRRHGRVWLIRSDASLAGYLILTYGFDLEFGGRQAIITDLYVRPAFRRAGLGALAMAKAMEFCQRQGLRSIELQVERRNKRALRFYKSLGFKAHDRLPHSKWIRD